MNPFKSRRSFVAAVALGLVLALMLASLVKVLPAINPGVSEYYNKLGPAIAPNQVTVILFDWRGYDTLGETVIFITGVLVTALIFGRGRVGVWRGDLHEHSPYYRIKHSLVLEYFTPPLIILVSLLGIYLTLGGHATPGGGFQGGAVIASGVLLALLVYGRPLPRWKHSSLLKLASISLAVYASIGLVGWHMGGYYMYNVGMPLSNVSESLTHVMFIAVELCVMLAVSAGLMTVFFLLLREGVDEANN